nr:SGNH hydrolase-type esterase domain-containing protein [Tanacetum cinerariifolium]
MAVANRKSSSLLLIVAVVVLCPLTRIGCHENIHKEVAVFVFGDSLFDPGNNNYINTVPVLQANYLPYGESYFSPPTGRFSDGRLISDFIAEYARLPVIPPYLEPGNNEFTYGTNFASAGAGALIETLPGLIKPVFVPDQNSPVSFYVHQSSFRLVSVRVVDLQTQLQYFSDVENHYRQSLGFNEGETACCGSGPLRGVFSCGGKRGIPDYELCDNATEFLFFDSLHPNELASSQFAKMFWKGDPMVTGPYNLKALFDGKP